MWRILEKINKDKEKRKIGKNGIEDGIIFKLNNKKDKI